MHSPPSVLLDKPTIGIRVGSSLHSKPLKEYPIKNYYGSSRNVSCKHTIVGTTNILSYLSMGAPNVLNTEVMV